MITLTGTIVEKGKPFNTKDGQIQKVILEYDYKHKDDFRNDQVIVEVRSNDTLIEAVEYLNIGDIVKVDVEIGSYKASPDRYYPHLKILEIKPVDRRLPVEIVLPCKVSHMPPVAARTGSDGTVWHTGRIVVEHTPEGGSTSVFMIEGVTPNSPYWKNRFDALTVGDTLNFGIFFKTFRIKSNNRPFMVIRPSSIELLDRNKDDESTYEKDDIVSEYEGDDLNNIQESDDLPF